jgi:hypothetical protein
MNRDNSATSDGRRCLTYWSTPNGGRVCTRPLNHDGPCVDRVHNTTRPSS